MPEVEEQGQLSMYSDMQTASQAVTVWSSLSTNPIHVSVNYMFAIIDYNVFMIFQRVLKRFSILLNSNPKLSSAQLSSVLAACR